MKKILAALAASAMVLSMMSISAFAAGEDGDGSEIEDDTTVIEEDTETEAEPEVEVEPEVEAVPEVPASPATGNSPVAMAVIPVALAAAAVIAKKSK